MDSERTLVLIPDTNSLIRNPNIQTYGCSIEAERFTVMFVPEVLSELDDLKILHRDEGFRSKVESVIKRIKGFRSQGSLLEGVTIFKTVTIKTIAKEPRVKETLHWLDESNSDDKIIATSLEIQRRTPGAKVILVTSDINLQNKSEAARLPYIDTPDEQK